MVYLIMSLFNFIIKKSNLNLQILIYKFILNKWVCVWFLTIDPNKEIINTIQTILIMVNVLIFQIFLIRRVLYLLIQKLNMLRSRLLHISISFWLCQFWYVTPYYVNSSPWFIPRVDLGLIKWMYVLASMNKLALLT